MSEPPQEMEIEIESEENKITEQSPFSYYTYLSLDILNILTMLYGFIFSLGLMGDAFKILGGKTAGTLFKNVNNPIAGLMVGLLATVLVQSSSTSTSVIVSMVGADIIDVQTAIPMIMGANIGTSVTNTLVSIGQMNDENQRELSFAGATIHDFFNIICVTLFLPIECLTGFLYHWTTFLTKHMDGYDGGTFKSPLKYIVNPLIKLIVNVDKKKINKISKNELDSNSAGSLIKGGVLESLSDEFAGTICLISSLVLLCIFLYGLVTVLKKTFLDAGENCFHRLLFYADTWWGGYISMLIGALLTIAVQSSSVTTSAITPLVGLGIISVEQMYPITLGANIGTTCTSLLAALVTGKVNALQIALCHLSFNSLGIILLYPIDYIRKIPITAAKFMGKIAKHYKYFPIIYLISVFVLMPFILLGISLLFELNTLGIIFGSVLSIMLVLFFFKIAYWINYQNDILMIE
jgi:sodium-dependent phosphate cotransporter